MRLYERESKELLSNAGVPTPERHIATTPQDAKTAAEKLGGPVVLKAQVPVGGRMKAGGVLFADSPEEAQSAAERILGSSIRNYRVDEVLIERRVEISKELFLAVTYDTGARSPVVVASVAGGIDIEQAETPPVRRNFPVQAAFPAFMGREIASELGLSGGNLLKMAQVITQAANLFLSTDALLVEINPLGLKPDGELIALDAHVELEDDGLFRHKDIVTKFGLASRGERPRSDFERKAEEIDHADHRGVAGRMVEFDGELGLLIGGGGASLTAFDAILDAGLSPANYCEIGGNPSVWKVKELAKLILAQPKVKRLAVIMNVVSNTRVDLVARGVIKGIVESGRNPADTLVAFRIPGSWEDEGMELLRHYGVRAYDRTTSIDQVVAEIARQEVG